MSDSIKHECGIALVRLKKPLSYYQIKYDSALWGFNQLFLLMEKQHNRGQDGSGVGALKLDVEVGKPYMFRKRSAEANSMSRIFSSLLDDYNSKVDEGTIHPEFATTVKDHFDFGAEIFLGHLRYGTSGGYSEASCHPYFRRNNWPTRNLMVAGNFNMTNTDELNRRLIDRGQHPVFDTDTQTILEEIGYHLDEEHRRLYHENRDVKDLSGMDNAKAISEKLDVGEILKESSKGWDGGYSIAGMIGNGDCFATRDPWGIRPFHFFEDDEVVAIASERAPLMTVFSKEVEEIQEINPGEAIIIKKNGTLIRKQIRDQQERVSCSFERIYFSRGNDHDIYLERKALGKALVGSVLKTINNDLENSVFSFIPNTAEVAYYGLMDGLREERRKAVKEEILAQAETGKLDSDFLDRVIMSNWPRSEKVALKDIKLRTFISQEKTRTNLASHVYDISYGSVSQTDNLICLDDSIVRGTTLKQSIIKILARLKPKQIIIVSTAPQIRYPDCYGIDMSQLHKFIAFEAAIELLKDQGREQLIRDVYLECVEQAKQPIDLMGNKVKRIYDSFTPEEISVKISQKVRPELDYWNGKLTIIFQNIHNLHESLPHHKGDWYFTGNYPTPGGFRALNTAFINYYEEREERSY
ncbi:MAG: class II glutamine amidotransferase [Verrucomicrobia bacterium]|nr:class II glutamine amidotransferase [Verrucomicrobiota bacterium]MDA1065668.1 class II glutamine amidotransferase [Verrucomicrobiota bacterium]